MNFRYSCISGVGFRHSVSTFLVQIHMRAANFEPTHFSPFHPSILSITVIAQENTDFGCASVRQKAKGKAREKNKKGEKGEKGEKKDVKG